MKERRSWQSAAIHKTLQFVEQNPRQNFARLVEWGEPFVRRENHKQGLKTVKQWMKQPNHPAMQFVDRAFHELNPQCLEKLVNNYLLNATLKGRLVNDEISQKYDINVPWTILMDPTSACNLNCIGCWAAEYDKKASMDKELLNRIIEEGKTLGIYMYLYSGGEPLLRKDDLLDLARKHQDCMFMAFTNATLIDDAFAAQVAEAGNFAFAVSVEGFEEETDLRRGKGTYQRIMKGMDHLKRHGVAFGFSTCYHQKNADAISSDAYLDHMIEKGCLFGWYFTYIPLGNHADMSLLATPEQRKMMYHRIHQMREEKPLFLIDFWNDGIYTNGCIAGGRNYFHINANGDVEPCAFVHYATDNIRDKPLLEALQNPLFKAFRQGQPFDHNLLRPCPMLDNPEKLQEMVEKTGAVSTQLEDRESASTLVSKTIPAANAWKPVADKLWEAHQGRKQA